MKDVDGFVSRTSGLVADHWKTRKEGLMGRGEKNSGVNEESKQSRWSLAGELFCQLRQMHKNGQGIARGRKKRSRGGKRSRECVLDGNFLVAWMKAAGSWDGEEDALQANRLAR